MCFENLGVFVEKFEIKETGEYWCADFDDVIIDTDTVEFIYQNGIKYLEATITSMKSISDRSLILLSFLLGVIAYFVNIVKTHVDNKNFSVVDIVKTRIRRLTMYNVL